METDNKTMWSKGRLIIIPIERMEKLANVTAMLSEKVNNIMETNPSPWCLKCEVPIYDGSHNPKVLDIDTLFKYNVTPNDNKVPFCKLKLTGLTLQGKNLVLEVIMDVLSVTSLKKIVNKTSSTIFIFGRGGFCECYNIYLL